MKNKNTGQTKMYVKGYGVYGYIDKTDEIIEKIKIAENAMTNLQDAQMLQTRRMHETKGKRS